MAVGPQSQGQGPRKGEASKGQPGHNIINLLNIVRTTATARYAALVSLPAGLARCACAFEISAACHLVRNATWVNAVSTRSVPSLYPDSPSPTPSHAPPASFTSSFSPDHPPEHAHCRYHAYSKMYMLLVPYSFISSFYASPLLLTLPSPLIISAQAPRPRRPRTRPPFLPLRIAATVV